MALITRTILETTAARFGTITTSRATRSMSVTIHIFSRPFMMSTLWASTTERILGTAARRSLTISAEIGQMTVAMKTTARKELVMHALAGVDTATV